MFINGYLVEYSQFSADLPWDVMNVDTGEIRMLATYAEARTFAKEVGLP
jgi:hypothetical protein